MNENTLKGLVGGIVLGALAATGLTIGTGWAVVKGTAEAQAVDASNDALVEAYSDICVARYQAEPNRAQHDEALAKLEVYKQRDYVRQYGWSIMPGQSDPFRDSTDRCVEKLTRS
jgi:hypothetical protein